MLLIKGQHGEEKEAETGPEIQVAVATDKRQVHTGRREPEGSPRKPHITIPTPSATRQKNRPLPRQKPSKRTANPRTVAFRARGRCKPGQYPLEEHLSAALGGS